MSKTFKESIQEEEHIKHEMAKFDFNVKSIKPSMGRIKVLISNLETSEDHKKAQQVLTNLGLSKTHFISGELDSAPSIRRPGDNWTGD